MKEEIEPAKVAVSLEAPVQLKKKSILPKIVIPACIAMRSIAGRLLIVILLITVGVVLGMQIGKKQVAGELLPKVTPTSIPQPTATPALDETANWKTFRNSLYGFTFKYPVDWETETGPSPDVFVYGPKRKSNYPLHQVKFDIINAGNYDYTATAEKFLKKIFGEWGFSTKVFTTKIDKRDALYFEGELKWTDNTSYYSRAYVVKLDSGNFFEGVEYDSISGENRKTFDQILSTFKFLPVKSSADELTDWKTAINNTERYSFKYPGNWYYSNGVLASYDIVGYDSRMPFPSGSAKCDIFNKKGSVPVAVSNEKTFLDGEIKVVKALGEYQPDDMGLGKRDIFLIKDSKNNSLIFFCWAYNEVLNDKMKDLFSTFKFLD